MTKDEIRDFVIYLADVEYCRKTQEPVLHLQYVGKKDIVKKHLSDFNQHIPLAAFSKKHIEKIVELKTRWALSPKTRLIAHFDENQITWVVLRDNTGNTLIEKVMLLARKKEVVQQLSPKDAYLLGYLLGCEEMR